MILVPICPKFLRLNYEKSLSLWFSTVWKFEENSISVEWTWNCNFTKFPQCVCTVFLKLPKADFTKNQHFTEWKNKKFSLTENWRNFHTVHYRYVWFYWLFSRNIYHCVKIATVQYGKHRNLLSNFFSKKFAKATFSLLCSSRVDFTKYFSVIVNFSLFPHCDQLNFLLQGCELPAEIRCKTKPQKKKCQKLLKITAENYLKLQAMVTKTNLKLIRSRMVITWTKLRLFMIPHRRNWPNWTS